MFTELLNRITSKPRRLTARCFEPCLFKDPRHGHQLAADGYVHLKNILLPGEIEALRNLYEEARKMEGFQDTDYYINTIGFDDPGIRDFLKPRTEAILQHVLPRFIDTEKAEFPLGGGFCINPPHATRGCNPHQDPTCVDEIASYSMTTWISLNDMTPENGCMHMLKGSHLWGNLHRSVCMPWAFEKNTDHLWKYLEPVPTKAGDVLCFDVSTIHSSTANQTGQNRLALTVQTIPKNFQLISYFPSGKNSAHLYHIDKDYFIRESQYEKPSSKYPEIKTVRVAPQYSAHDIDELVLAYRQQMQNRPS